MSFSISISMVRNRIPEILRAFRSEASEIVRTSAYNVQAHILEGMSESHDGRIYGGHQASAPGEMPAVDSGTLIGSIAVDAQPGRLWAEVTAGTDYAAHLEFGTVNMEARPFMLPAIVAEQDNFIRQFTALGDRIG